MRPNSPNMIIVLLVVVCVSISLLVAGCAFDKLRLAVDKGQVGQGNPVSQTMLPVK